MLKRYAYTQSESTVGFCEGAVACTGSLAAFSVAFLSEPQVHAKVSTFGFRLFGFKESRIKEADEPFLRETFKLGGRLLWDAA